MAKVVRVVAAFKKSSSRLAVFHKRALSTASLLRTTGSYTISAGASGTSGKIKVNGVELYYERYGTGPHALLCIPGALGTVRTDFSPQMEYFGRLDSGFTVVGYDPRGYGTSRPPAREFTLDPLFYDIDAHDAVGVMKRLGFDKFSLLGWSDGGMAAIIASARYPRMIQNLVVWGSNAYVSQEDIENVERVRDVSQWSTKMRVPMETLYGGEFPGMWSNLADALGDLYGDPVRRGDICIQEVGEVQCQSLVVHGEKDALCPTFQAEFLAERLRDCRLVTYPEGKHNLHLRYHEQFNKLVSDFLQENNP